MPLVGGIGKAPLIKAPRKRNLIEHSRGDTVESTIAGILTFAFSAFVLWAIFGHAVSHYNATKAAHDVYLSKKMEEREKDRQKLVREASDAVFAQIVKGGFQITQKGGERAERQEKTEKSFVAEPTPVAATTSDVAVTPKPIEAPKMRIKEATGRVSSMGEVKKEGAGYFIYRVTLKKDDGSIVDFDGKSLKAQPFRIGDKVTIRQLPTVTKTGSDGKAFKANQFEVEIHEPEADVKDATMEADRHLVDDPIEAANEELHSASAQEGLAAQAELELFA